MSRRQAILESLLIFAVFCLQGAWPVPEVNEPYYLGKAIHYWNPQWASSDLFLQTADTHAVFYFSVGWLALILKPTALAWTVRLLTWALLAWSWQRLSRAVVPRAWISVLTATLFVFLLQHYNMAGEWVVGGAEGKGFAFALIFFALEAMVEGYWNRMWILLGVASAFHILVGGWAAVAAGTVWILRKWSIDTPAETINTLTRSASEAPSLALRVSNSPAASGAAKRRFCVKDCVPGLIAPSIALLLALFGLLPALWMNHGVEAGVKAQANQIYVFERFNHHLDPAKFWADGFVPPFLFIAGLWLLLWRSVSDGPGARRLRGFTATAVVIALIGTAIALPSLCDRALAAGSIPDRFRGLFLVIAGLYDRAVTAAWMRFYWYRLVDVAIPLGLALLGVRWLVQRKMRVALATVIAAAAFHAVDCIVLKLFSAPPFADRQVDGVAWRWACLWAAGRAERPLFPRQPRADKLRNYSDWVDACCWVSDPQNTPPDARFLIPRTAFTFKWYAGRGEVANWKETPQDAASMKEWWDRIQDVYSTGNQPPQEKYYLSLANAGVPKLQALARKYQADYLITQVSLPLLPPPVEVVYWNDSFVVYKLK
jgi:hypothetical protein